MQSFQISIEVFTTALELMGVCYINFLTFERVSVITVYNLVIHSIRQFTLLKYTIVRLLHILLTHLHDFEIIFYTTVLITSVT